MIYNWPVIGHEKQLTLLEKDIKTNNLSHAYLFEGPELIGKYDVAKTFANILLCENNYCHSCETCRQIKSNIFPDLITVDTLYIDKVNTDFGEITKHSNFPQKHRAKAPSAKTNKISIEDVREINNLLQMRTDSKYRILTIRNVERMKAEAQNALLKTLEEPPPKTIFLLTTSVISSLLKTIISRTRLLKFYPPPAAKVEAFVREQYPHSNDLEAVLKFTQSRPGRAVALLENPELLNQYQSVYNTVREFLKNRSLNNRFLYAETLSKNPAEIEIFLDIFTYLARQKLLTGVAEDQEESKHFISLIKKIGQVREGIAKNINSRLALEELMFHF